MLIINNNFLESTSWIDPTILNLFDKDEARIYTRKIKDRIGWAIDESEEDEEIAVEFISNGKTIKERLEIIGYTLIVIEEHFVEQKQEEIEFLEDMLHRHGESFELDIKEKISGELNLLKKTNLFEYTLAIKKLIENEYGFQFSDEEIESCTDLILKYLIQKKRNLQDLPFIDNGCTLLRAMLEHYPESVEIKYDITEMAIEDVNENGIKEDQLFEHYMYLYANEGEGKIIVLTEGSTDSHILRRSLFLLFPHLARYYSFMDFGASNAPGSAGNLTNTIKSFIGAGVKHRIIAIYDNDTAAYAAMKSIPKVIPNNIKIMNYPNIKIAEKYPTIGPYGPDLIKQNINQLAVSIELFFGKDILTSGQEFTPIRWISFEKGLERYHGEVERKNQLQDLFFDKLKTCENNPALATQYDWEDMKTLLRSILDAFI